MYKLLHNQRISSKALQFLILTRVRSGSVRLAERSEIDFTKKLWIIPAGHTKARKEHRVPLQPQSIKPFKSLPKLAGTQINFPIVKGGPLSEMALLQCMRGMYERGYFEKQALKRLKKLFWTFWTDVFKCSRTAAGPWVIQNYFP
jgi:integrase